MKYKRLVYTPIILFIVSVELATGTEEQNGGRGFAYSSFNYGTKLEKVTAEWNKTITPKPTFEKDWQNYRTENYQNRAEEEFYENEVFTESFPEQLTKCIGDHRYQITENYSQGKNIILNCFKATLILNLIKYLGASPKTSIKLFNGLIELKKIPSKRCREGADGTKKCEGRTSRHFEHLPTGRLSQEKKDQYIRMYKKAMEKLVNEKIKFSSLRNVTEEEKKNQLDRINEGSQAFLLEVLRNLGDENAEKEEEKKLKKEITDPRLLSVLDVFSKKYMMKVKFYPGVSARMMRSANGGITFDLDLEENSEEKESDGGSTREVKAIKKKGKDNFENGEIYISSGGNNNNYEVIGIKKRKKGRRKRKEKRKKAKRIKKIAPYLLLPFIIQISLLPIVFKKLFFLALKALVAGKVALILIGFNLLRNTCIHEDRYAQRIRVEHYGYNKGGEYGAWINGRAFQEPEIADALSEIPFPAHNPVSS